MPFYETVYISRQDLTETQVKELTDSLTKILEKEGGKVHKVEQWGLRNFAYPINKSKRGHYTLIESDAPGAALIEMERNMRLHEDVVRYMSVKEEKLSEGPSVMMDKGGDRNDDERSSKKKEAA